MKTMTISLRLNAEEVRLLDQTAASEGVDRSSLLKRVLRRGYADCRFDSACAAYRRGEVSLSRAAEMAGLSVGDMLARLPAADLHLNLTADDLRRELAS